MAGKKRKPLTEAKPEQVFAQVEVATKQKLEEIARREDRPISQLVREAIKQYLLSREAA